METSILKPIPCASQVAANVTSALAGGPYIRRGQMKTSLGQEHIPEELASSIPSVTNRFADSMSVGMTPRGEHETVSQLPLGEKFCTTSSQSTGDCECLKDFTIVAAKKQSAGKR